MEVNICPKNIKLSYDYGQQLMIRRSSWTSRKSGSNWTVQSLD